MRLAQPLGLRGLHGSPDAAADDCQESADLGYMCGRRSREHFEAAVREAGVGRSRILRARSLRPIDVGDLSKAHWLEGLGFLHIGLQISRGTNFATAIRLING